MGATFDSKTGKVVNDTTADQLIAMQTFADKMAAENAARLKGLQAQQRQYDPVTRQRWGAGQLSMQKGLPSGQAIASTPTGWATATTPSSTAPDQIIYPTYKQMKGGTGSKDNREVISPAEQYRRTMAEIAGQYDPLTAEAAATKEAGLTAVADAIKTSGGDIGAALEKFKASIGPSKAYQGVQLAAPALAGENPLMAALAQQGAGTGEVFAAQAQQNELANLQNKLAQENVTAQAGWQQDLLNALRDYGTSTSQYATDVTLPAKQKAGEAQVASDYQAEIDKLAKQRANEERAALKKKAAAKVKVVAPKKKV